MLADMIEVEVLRYWDEDDAPSSKQDENVFSRFCVGCRSGWEQNLRESLVHQTTQKVCVATSIVVTRNETKSRLVKCVNQSVADAEYSPESIIVENTNACASATAGNVTVLYNDTVMPSANGTHFLVNESYDVEVAFETEVCEGTLQPGQAGTWVISGENAISREECLARCADISNCFAVNFVPTTKLANPSETFDGGLIDDQRRGFSSKSGNGTCLASKVPAAINRYSTPVESAPTLASELWTRNRPQLRGLDEVEIVAEDSAWMGYGSSVRFSTDTNRSSTFGIPVAGSHSETAGPSRGNSVTLGPTATGQRIVGILPGTIGTEIPWEHVTSEWSRKGSYAGFHPINFTSAKVGGVGNMAAIDDLQLLNSSLDDAGIRSLLNSYSRHVWPGAEKLAKAQPCKLVEGSGGRRWSCTGIVNQSTRVFVVSLNNRTLLRLSRVVCSTVIERLLGAKFFLSGPNLERYVNSANGTGARCFRCDLQTSTSNSM